MPPRVSKNISIFVVDIGKHSGKCVHPGGQSYLDKVKQIMINLVKKQIFLSPNDEIGIVTYGSKGTKNSLCHSNIEVQNVAVANWDVLKYLEDLTSTDVVTPFENALETAFELMGEHLMENTGFYNYKDKRVYYFYNYMDTLDHSHNYKKIQNRTNEDIKMWCM